MDEKSSSASPTSVVKEAEIILQRKNIFENQL